MLKLLAVFSAGMLAASLILVLLYAVINDLENPAEVFYSLLLTKKKHTVVKTLEPLRFFPNKDDEEEGASPEDKVYILPAGTHLHEESVFGEGVIHYHVYFAYKGRPIKAEDVSNVKRYHYDNYGRSPIWLHTLDSD